MGHLRGMALAIVLLLPVNALAAVHVMTNGRITIDFADPSYGNSGDSDRVDFLLWIDSSGESVGNLAASSSRTACNEPAESWGQSYSDAQTGAGRWFLISGIQSSSTGDLLRTIALTDPKATTCLPGVTPAGAAKTEYELSRQSSMINALHVVRTFVFRPHTPLNNLKVYEPRMHEATYDKVIIPDSTGVLKTYSAFQCPFVCEISNWNGVWFADDDGSGNGLVVIRDAASAAPAVVSIDNDCCTTGSSNSNLTSIALVAPADGWPAKMTESEYLCFYDSTSWPAASQAAGTLPTGCQVR